MKELNKYNRDELQAIIFSFAMLLEDEKEKEAIKRIHKEYKVLKKNKIIK